MKNGGRNGMKNGGRIGMKNGGRKCIRNGVLKRRVGLALSDTLSTPTGGQKNGEKIKPQNGENFGTKTGKIFVPACANGPYSDTRADGGENFGTAKPVNYSEFQYLAITATLAGIWEFQVLRALGRVLMSAGRRGPRPPGRLPRARPELVVL